MKSAITAIGLAIGLGGASAAAAQYGSAAQPQPQQPRATAQPEEAPAPKRAVKVSKGAQKAILELEAAVNANDTANIPAKLAAAQAAAKDSNDLYVIAGMRLRAAVAAQNNAEIAAGIESLLSSGGVPEADRAQLQFALSKAYRNLNQPDKAATTLEALLAKQPSNVEATVSLGEARVAQGRVDDGVATIRKAIAMVAASGQKPAEEWYKRAVGLAYKAQSPAAIELSRDWVRAYPSALSWRDALRIYLNLGSLDDSAALDLFRLARVTGALAGETQYHRYALSALNKGFPGEAKAVIEEAGAAKAIDPAKPLFRDIVARARDKASGDRAALDASAKAAVAAGSAARTLSAGDAFYSYGEFARAVELYRAAAAMNGADAALVNLHLGMALARQGDKAGATAALNAVTGPRAEMAKYWLTYLAVQG